MDESTKFFWGLYVAIISSLVAITICLINNYLINKKIIAELCCLSSQPYKNEENCPCLNKACERHGKCCECINFHRSKNGIVFCMQVEKNQTNIG